MKLIRERIFRKHIRTIFKLKSQMTFIIYLITFFLKNYGVEATVTFLLYLLLHIKKFSLG